MCEEKLKEYNKHLEHGYGVPGMGPYHSDCECRETSEREICAISGCGFCIADIQRERVTAFKLFGYDDDFEDLFQKSQKK